MVEMAQWKSLFMGWAATAESKKKQKERGIS